MAPELLWPPGGDVYPDPDENLASDSKLAPDGELELHHAQLQRKLKEFLDSEEMVTGHLSMYKMAEKKRLPEEIPPPVLFEQNPLLSQAVTPPSTAPVNHSRHCSKLRNLSDVKFSSAPGQHLLCPADLCVQSSAKGSLSRDHRHSSVSPFVQ